MNKILDGVNYILLDDKQIRNYVIKICEKEWDTKDFPKYGRDLYDSVWKLEEIEIAKINPNNELLQSESFQADVIPRVKKQRKIYETKTAVAPLILRGKDLLIFDGYARYLFFKERGIKKCLAYVGYNK